MRPGLRVALGAAIGGLGALAIHDLTQRRHAILRNYPVIGHLRFLLETVGPELRQYIVTDNNEERPFSRDQRRWVYASAKGENNYFGFGTDNDLETSASYVIIKPAAFPHRTDDTSHTDPTAPVPCAKVLGGHRGRPKAFRPSSVINLSAMSYGALSGPAIEALNRGADLAGCLHNTGEGGIAPEHRHGGDLIWQIGTGYYGCRDDAGDLDLAKLVDTAAEADVKAIEIKLSQGAKPGLGGMLPAAKVTPTVAAMRGVPVGTDCISPPYHSAFRDVDELLDLVETIATDTGLPVGIKSAVGGLEFWHDLADQMAADSRGVDFISIDGGEGGTGAAPLVFTDHVALPFKLGFSRVYRTFAERGLHENVVFCGGGKLGMPESALLAMAMGCDLVGVAREAMLAVGCIQAQRCHTGHCPTGVATQNPWLIRGLDPTLKSTRFATYVATLRHELLRLSRSCGVAHPGLVRLEQIDIVEDRFVGVSAREVFEYEPEWGDPSPEDRRAICELMNLDNC